MTERFDRILGIPLFLRSGQAVSAPDLARRFAVSTRTIHRDLKTTVVMTFGEDNRATVLELLRWLRPGAELLEPADWRRAMREDLRRMLASYSRELG